MVHRRFIPGASPARARAAASAVLAVLPGWRYGRYRCSWGRSVLGRAERGTTTLLDGNAVAVYSGAMKRLLIAVITAATLAVPAAAQARPCSDSVPVVVRGVQWIVFTGDSTQERQNLSCAKARRIAKRMLSQGQGTPGWRCKNTLRLKRCVRGGTYVDDNGFTQWRYLVGWHLAD